MLRIGLVGCGTHAKWSVMPAIQKTSKHCCLRAVCDLNADNLQSVVDPEVAKFTDFTAMLRETELDAVYICTMCDAHYEPALRALQAGLHVICEKPMADTIEKCKTMIQTAKEADRLLAVVFENRYHPYNRKIHEWISAGHLGTVGAIHFHDLWDGHKNFGELSARRARAIERSGSLDCGIHQLDLARYFAGGGDWQDVSALGSWFGEELRNPPHISLLGRLAGGILVTLNSSYAYGAYIPKHRAHSRLMTLVGDKGVINFSTDDEKGTDLKLISADLTDTFAVAGVPHELAIGWLLDDFAAVVRGEKPMPPELATGHDGLMAQVAVQEALTQACAHKPLGNKEVHS